MWYPSPEQSEQEEIVYSIINPNALKANTATVQKAKNRIRKNKKKKPKKDRKQNEQSTTNLFDVSSFESTVYRC